jgi:hypothetical protein
MNKPMTEQDMIKQALVPFGFINGCYESIPFSLQFSSFPHAKEPTHYHVIIDGRVIAEVGVAADGTFPVRMQLSEWLKGSNSKSPFEMDDDYRAAVARRAEAVSSRRTTI